MRFSDKLTMTGRGPQFCAGLLTLLKDSNTAIVTISRMQHLRKAALSNSDPAITSWLADNLRDPNFPIRGSEQFRPSILSQIGDHNAGDRAFPLSLSGPLN
jgi:hypothetical protein